MEQIGHDDLFGRSVMFLFEAVAGLFYCRCHTGATGAQEWRI